MGGAERGTRRDEILAAAAFLFAEHGYHGASMHDIGARVGMLKGSLYAHVANKEELLLEIVSTAARRFFAALESVNGDQDAASETLRRAVGAHRATARALGPMARVYLLEARHLEGQPAIWAGETRDRYAALWCGIVQRGIADGSFRADLDVETAVTLILAAVTWQYWGHGDRDGRADEADSDALSALLLAAFR